MNTSNNIINLTKHRKEEATTNRQFPQLVNSALLNAKNHLKTLLPEFFSRIDDSLFELLDKAANNQQQTLYFDAMREMRLQKTTMEKRYFSALETEFQRTLVTPDLAQQQHLSLEQAGLVNDEELEESLAITNMSSSAENNYREALFGLTARLNFLIEDMEITHENSPLRPAVFCEAFKQTAQLMDTDLKVRLIIYKLFDKFVIKRLKPMYEAINADLIAAGVLPRISGSIKKSASYPPETRTASHADHQDSPQANSTVTGNNIPHGGIAADTESGQSESQFSTLQQLLSMQRSAAQPGTTAGIRMGNTSIAGGSATAQAAGGGASGGAASGGTAVATVYPSTHVISALSQLQNSAQEWNGAKDQTSADAIKAGVTEELIRISGTKTEMQLGQPDTDAIDIISMLFDFILDDPTLSNHLKAQIARLQIPMLKVAILDKQFFTHKTHPARQLLNELAYAGSGLEDCEWQQDATFQMVAYIVDRILKDFREDISFFDELLDEFTRFIENEREANRRTEAMLEQARELVASEIQRRVTDNRVPPLVSTLLIEAWKDVLTHLYLRDGENSTAWNTALQVADDLIWSVQPKLIVSERQRLIKIIPRVLNGLRDGLTLIQFDDTATEQFFAGLERLHLASLKGGLPSEQPAASSAQTKSVDSLFEDDDFGMDLSGLPEADNLQEQDEILDEITLASTQSTLWSSEAQLSDFEAEIKDMALGTWVEFTDAETGRHNRGKLAWKCDFTGEYTFVDRKYKVVADLSFRVLAREIQLNKARIVEDVPLFDRALDSVIGGIKRALDKSTAAQDTAH